MTVRTERRDAVLVVTIDRPEVRNAVDLATAEELASGETVAGAARFRDGAGRGGRFD